MTWLTWHFIYCIMQQATEVAEHTNGLVQYMGHNKATEDMQQPTVELSVGCL